MMRPFLTITLALFGLGCQSPQKPVDPVQPTQKVKEFLGDSVLLVLSSPESVQAIRLDPTFGTAPDSIDGFRILSRGPMLSAEQTRHLQNLIMDEKSYDFEHMKHHPMDPLVCYQFKKGSTIVNVSVSFAGNLWQFTSGGKTVVEDNDPIRKHLVHLAKQLFPNDTVIQGVEEKR